MNTTTSKEEKVLNWIKSASDLRTVWQMRDSKNNVYLHKSYYFNGVLPKGMTNHINGLCFDHNVEKVIDGIRFLVKTESPFVGQPNRISCWIDNEPELLAKVNPKDIVESEKTYDWYKD